MDKKQDMISFTLDDGSSVSFFVLGQVMITGINYILVTDSEDGEDNAYILKELREECGESVYEMVDDGEELLAISKVFEETIGDVDIEFD